MQSPVKIWRNQKKITSLLGQTGTIISWTIVRVPTADFTDQAPFPVALIDLKDGRRIISQVVDCEIGEIAVGKKVRTLLRRVMKPSEEGIIPYGIKVKIIY